MTRFVFPERIVAQTFESTHKKEIKRLTQTVVFLLRIRNIGKNEIILWSVLSGVLLLGLPQGRDSELLLNLSQSIHLKLTIQLTLLLCSVPRHKIAKGGDKLCMDETTVKQTLEEEN